jgi:hypothetical protein
MNHSKIITKENGDKIKFSYRNEDYIGTYNLATDQIIKDGISYPSLSNFGLMQVRKIEPDRKSLGGWEVCKLFRNGNWISTKNLPCTFCPGKYEAEEDDEELY